MTVAELIEILKTMPQDLTVRRGDSEFYGFEVTEVKVVPKSAYEPDWRYDYRDDGTQIVAID